MDQVRAQKRSKISSEPSSSSPAGSSATIQSPGTDSSLSRATVTRVERSELLLMDESFSVRLNAHTDSDADGGSSDEEGTEEFSIISAEHIYYDWLQQLPKSDVKMMAMVAMDTFIARFGLTTVGAAKEVGLFLQLNEKTVRTWRKDFYANHGSLSESRQGKHARPYVLDDEECRRKAREWVRLNATSKGTPNMTATMFSSWVNTKLLPHSDLPPGCPQQIAERTAVKWLHEICFHPQSHKKDVYIDGHERDDVVEYRKLFLRKLEIMEATHLPKRFLYKSWQLIRVQARKACASICLG